ncbi:protein rolling stone-like [Antedon mediterranea]|uniref:protein rolling stone-like n=1 Tax=Antedon mediterranea TaxID=105859 RepID=UPI003AF99746
MNIGTIYRPTKLMYSKMFSTKIVRRRFWIVVGLLSTVFRRFKSWSEDAFQPIGFRTESAKRFAVPIFNWQTRTYIIYRCAIAFYQLLWLLLVVIKWVTKPRYEAFDTRWKWFIYVSNLSYLWLTVYFIVAAFAVIAYHKGPTDASDTVGDVERIEGGQYNTRSTRKQRLPIYFSLSWFLQVIAYSTAVAVTILYWTLDYDPAEDIINVHGVHVHGINAMLVVIDSLIVANPYRYIHFIYPSLYALVYFGFTVIYWAKGGLDSNGHVYIYKGHLDWGNNSKTSLSIAVLTVCVGAPFLHCLFWILFKMKEIVFKPY